MLKSDINEEGRHMVQFKIASIRKVRTCKSKERDNMGVILKRNN